MVAAMVVVVVAAAVAVAAASVMAILHCKFIKHNYNPVGKTSNRS